MALMLFSGVIINYSLRVMLSVFADPITQELGWTEAQRGLMLSSFYWGYTVGMCPSGEIAVEYGTKWVFAFSILVPCILALVFPVATRHSFGLCLLVCSLIGLFESATFAAIYNFYPLWIPLKEKTIMVNVINSGCNVVSNHNSSPIHHVLTHVFLHARAIFVHFCLLDTCVERRGLCCPQLRILADGHLYSMSLVPSALFGFQYLRM